MEVILVSSQSLALLLYPPNEIRYIMDVGDWRQLGFEFGDYAILYELLSDNRLSFGQWHTSCHC